MELLSSIAVILLLYILLDYLINNHSIMGTKKMPGPPRLPFIGSTHYLFKSGKDLMVALHDFFEKYPSPSFVGLPSKSIYLIHHPEHLETILMSPKTIEKDDIYSFFNPWLGPNLFTEPEEKWRIHKKLILPSFNSRNMVTYAEIFSSHSITLIDELSVHLNKGEFRISEYIRQCVLSTNLEVAMDLKIKKSEKSLAFSEAVERLVELVSYRMKTVWLHPDFIFNRTSFAKEQAKYIERTNAFVMDLIEDRNKISTLETNNEDSNPIGAPTRNRHEIMYDKIIDYYNKGVGFTEEEVYGSMRAALFAANDTTSSTLDFVILMLASFPEYQEKIYKELHLIYGNEDPSILPVKNEDLSHMKYLEQFIKETLRIFPIAPFLFRRLTSDIELGGYTLRNGSAVAVGIMRLHRGQEYWKDPLKFDPERFTSEECASRHPFAYIPFSAGPRGCFGLKYAMMMMKIIIGTILRRYKMIKNEILPIEDIQLKFNIVISPVIPVKIRIEERISNSFQRKKV